MYSGFYYRSNTIILIVLAISMHAKQIVAHCDSIDGPVVTDARLALEKNNPNLILKWVSKEQEAEILDAFKQTMKVRAKDSDAKELADRFFFETLVRLHRLLEGEAFTKLIQAKEVDPGIAAADNALLLGSVKELAEKMSLAVKDGIEKRFALVFELKKLKEDSVDAGRKYVRAYVDYIHFVEGINRLATHGSNPRHAARSSHSDE